MEGTPVMSCFLMPSLPTKKKKKVHKMRLHKFTLSEQQEKKKNEAAVNVNVRKMGQLGWH